MKTALRLFVLVLSCSAALGGTITVPSWTAAQLQSGESANFVTGGPDGNVWATEQAKGQILKINPADGSVTRYPLPANTIPLQITAGSDGNLWFSGGQLQGSSPVSIIGRVTTAGGMTIFNYPDPMAFTLLASGPIAGSSDGKVYVVNTTNYKIGIISPAASAKVRATSLAVTEIATPFGIGNLLVIAARLAGGIDFCGTSKEVCGTVINGQLNSFHLPMTAYPTGVDECTVAGGANMMCVDTTSSIGGGESRLWTCNSSGTTCTSSTWPNDSCAAGKLSCNGADCVAGAAPSLSYNTSCQDLKAADLTSSTTTNYKVSGPGGAFLLDPHLFRTRDLYVVAAGQSLSTHDGVVEMGKVVAPNCDPPVSFGSGMNPFSMSARVGDSTGLNSGLDVGFIQGVPPIVLTITGQIPSGWTPSADSSRVGGTCLSDGDFTFAFTATDARGCKATLTVIVHVEKERPTPLLDALGSLASPSGRH